MSRGRRRLVLVALAAVAAAALAGVLIAGRSSAPRTAAERLVPADVLLYVHASTDPGREQDQRLFDLLERFRAFQTIQARLEAVLGPRSGAFSLRRDVRPWLGGEAALAVTPRGGALALLAVEDRDRAQGVLRRLAGGGTGFRHRGVLVQRFSGGAAAFVEDFLVVGPEAELRRVVDLAAGRGEPLAERRDYARLSAGRDDDRVLDAWAAPGARRLAGARARRLPDAPVVAGLVPVEDGLRVTARVGGEAGPGFSPQLPDALPADALGYVGLRSLQPLVDLLPERGPAAVRFIAALRPLARALDREVALAVSPAKPDPVVTLAARAGDPEAARVALGSLQGVVAELLAGSEADTGLVPTFEERDLGDGLTGFTLALAGGGELVTAVEEDRVVISNAADGVRQVLRGDEGLTGARRFGELVGDPPSDAQLLCFLDLSRLLALGERAGLAGVPAYEAASDDARKLRAAGAVVQRQGNDTTVELNLRIP